MAIDVSFLRSKVARRIFVLFIVCAMVPISGLAVLSYFQVSSQLEKQSMDRLYNSVKAHGMSIYERFLFLETNMHLVANALNESHQTAVMDIEKILGNYGQKRFDSMALIDKSGRTVSLYKEFGRLPDDLLETVAEKAPGKTIVLFGKKPDQTPAVYMASVLDENNPESDILVGQVEISHLWGIGYENMLPPMTGLCIVDQFRKVLISSFETSDNLLHRVTLKREGKSPNYFQYNLDNKGYFVSYWPMFMKSGFDAPNVSVVLRRSKADVLSPLDNFKKIFPLVILLSFWVVALLSVYYIRKSLVPLEELKKGTLRIAKRDFKNEVSVSSNDEFEELADSFNSMSRSLDRNFDALSTLSEIDRAILSSLNVKKIVNRSLKRMYTFFSCDSIGISLSIDKKPFTYHSYITTNIKVRKLIEEFHNMAPADEQMLHKNQKYILIDLKQEQPGCVAPGVVANMVSILVLPLFLNENLKGLIALGFKDNRNHSKDDLSQARQIADQVTVALANSSLVEELEKLNLGTLEALARTVDAKSAWTAGHSERVTDLSVKIAKIMGLEEKYVETLRRGAYLHDIGKIGIPLSILDKPGRLNDEEYEIIKDHPLIGARILEPIEAYADVLTMISQHHEKYNGTGYPYGLAGEDISLGARIMAVADVYDAVVSDRPYRHGWIEEKAVNMITKEAGAHFDPTVVDAFLVAVS